MSRTRVAAAARWFRAAKGRAQRMARRRSLIAALADARRAREDRLYDEIEEPWEREEDDHADP